MMMGTTISSVAEVREIIHQIREMAAQNRDAECHSMEDALKGLVLESIAAGRNTDSPQDLAAATLQSGEIEFARRCD
jgi:hypothetical protein